MKRPLTVRERQVAELLLRGWGNIEIGRELGIAPRTVKAKFHQMFEVCGIDNGDKRIKLAVLLYHWPEMYIVESKLLELK